MKQRFYFDTSVFGGVFDNEFEEATLQLFEQLKLGKIVCVYSDLTESELIEAPEKVSNDDKIKYTIWLVLFLILSVIKVFK